jgi:hypothetical protein
MRKLIYFEKNKPSKEVSKCTLIEARQSSVQMQNDGVLKLERSAAISIHCCSGCDGILLETSGKQLPRMEIFKQNPKLYSYCIKRETTRLRVAKPTT